MYNMTAAHAAAINNRLIKLAVDAEMNTSAACVVLGWLNLAQKWAERHARPALRDSCRRMADRLTCVTCDACGGLTARAEALVIRNGTEVFLCPGCQGGAGTWNI